MRSKAGWHLVQRDATTFCPVWELFWYFMWQDCYTWTASPVWSLSLAHTHTHIHTFDLQHFVELSYEPGVDAGCCDLHNSKRGTGNLQPVVWKQAFLFESGKACRLLLSWCVRMGYGGIFRLMSCYHILISCKLSGMKQPACFCCAWVCILWDASSMMLLMCCFCAWFKKNFF